MNYGLRWSEFNRRDQLVTKERFFRTTEDRSRFIKNVEARNNFNQIVAFWEG